MPPGDPVIMGANTGTWGQSSISLAAMPAVDAAPAPNPSVLGESPFTFLPLPPPDPRLGPSYSAINGKELGHILYIRARRALEQHHMFQPGLVYRDSEFTFILEFTVPDGGTTQSKLADFITSGRTGGEVLPRLLQRFGDALVSHHMFQEGAAYPIFLARLILHCDRAQEAPYTTAIVEFAVGPDDAPDRVRMAHGLPVAVIIPQQPDEQGPPVDDPPAMGVRTDVAEGDSISHKEFNSGKPVIVQQVDAEGLHVRAADSAQVRKIGVGSKIYREAKVGKK